MAKITVHKPIAVCLLDAVKLVLGQLATYRMQMAELNRAVPDALPKTYTDVRSLRDRIQRSVGAYPKQVELDFTDGEGDLLVSVAGRALELLETDIATSDPDAGGAHRNLAKESLRILQELAPKFASRPVCALPGHPEGATIRARRALEDAVVQKLRGDTAAAMESGALQGMGQAKPAAELAPDGLAGGGGFGMGRTSVERPPDSPMEGAAGFGALRGGIPMGQSAEAGGALGEQPPSRSPVRQGASEAPWRKESSGVGQPRPAAGGPAAPHGLVSVAPMEQEVADQGALAHLVDARLIRDPRLRSLVGMDLKAVQRASRAGDFRLVAVLLRSVLCAVAWDAALQRRRELGLKGGPDTWRLPDVVTALLGAALSSSDAMQVSALDRASELLHPPAQLIRPQVVTRATVDGFLELVGRLSRSLTVPAQ